MTSNVVEIVETSLTTETVENIAQALGEAPLAVQRALQAAVPAVFLALNARAQDPQGAQAIADSIKDGHAAKALADPDRSVGVSEGGPVDRLISDRVELCRTLAEYASIKGEASRAVLGTALSLALGALARTVSVPLVGENVRRLLAEQENHVVRAMPPDFHAPDLLPQAATPPANPKRANVWAWIIGLLLVALVIAAMFAYGAFERNEPATEQTVLPATAPGEPAGEATVPTETAQPPG